MKHEASWSSRLKRTICSMLRVSRFMKDESGQVLLIAIMLMAVTLTIVLSITFTSRTDTQLTKLEEESQKALNAAEAGIEAALKNAGNVTIGEGGILSQTEYEGQATIATTYEKTTFAAPIVQKDEQYTLYMGTYDKDANTVGASLAEDVNVCFGSPNQTTKTAIEVTLVKGSGPYTLKRYVGDPDSRVSGTLSTVSNCSNTAFRSQITIPAADIGTTTKVMIVRVLFNSSKIFFSRSSAFPLQGKYITSEATSSKTGVSKRIELFQSYPQIPSDFFVTGF